MNEDKPLVRMNELELQRTFDEIGSDIVTRMLNDARTKAPEVALAAVLLVTDEKRMLVSFVPEYGDDEGIAQMKDLLLEIRRCHKLQDGERVELVILERHLDHFQWRPLG